MTDNNNEKLLDKETMTTEPVIDKHYQLIETKRAEEIIEKAMNLAREEIPKGAVATYIPELGKMDPHQLGPLLLSLLGHSVPKGSPQPCRLLLL